MAEPTIIHVDDTPRDGWDDALHGKLSWHTLLSGELTPTEGLTSGMAVLEPGDHLNLHRHETTEAYFIFQGEGLMMLDGTERPVRPGHVIFIPGNALHGIRNEGTETLKFFYAFLCDSFADVIYEY